MSPLVSDVLHVAVFTHDPAASLVAAHLAGRAIVCRAVPLEQREDAAAAIASIDPDAAILEADAAGDAQVVDAVLRVWPQLPLIIVGKLSAFDWSSLVARGVDDVLGGDASAEQIERAVRHAVLRRRQSMPLAAPRASMSDAHLGFFIKLISEPMAIVDGAGKAVAVNDAFCAHLKLQPDDILWMSPGELVRRAGDGATTERIRRDRYQLVVRSIAQPGRSGPEAPAPPSEDVAFRALAESSPTAIYIEQNHRIVYANAAAAILTGIPVEELLELDPVSFVHPEWRAVLAERRQLRLRGESVPSRFEVKMQTRDGKDRWVDLTAVVIQHAGRPALLVNAIDISDRRRLEEQLLLRGRLDAVGRLAGGIAHDFNNLLQIMRGHIDLLLDSYIPAHPMYASLNAIREAAARATALTEQLLAVGRRQMLLPKLVDVNDLITRFTALLAGALPANVRLHRAQADRLPAIRVDESRLEQTLSHLVSNAYEAMPDGGDLTITTKLVNVEDQELTPRLRTERASAPPGTYVAIEVQDTGHGMTPEVMAQAFEPFFSTKPNSPGAGLGLSTVYGIIKQSGGYITGDSTPGRGTCWSIWLPPASAAVPAPAPRTLPLRADLRILLVEDEPAVRGLLYDTLTREGLNVVALGSAEEALESWVDNSFDMLITDVGLPGLTGPDLAKELLARAPELRVIFISGYVADSLGSWGIDPNAVFLQKPFNPRELARRVRQVAAQPVKPA